MDKLLEEPDGLKACFKFNLESRQHHSIPGDASGCSPAPHLTHWEPPPRIQFVTKLASSPSSHGLAPEYRLMDHRKSVLFFINGT